MRLQFMTMSFPTNTASIGISTSWNRGCRCEEFETRHYFSVGINLVFWQISCSLTPEDWGIRGVVE